MSYTKESFRSKRSILFFGFHPPHVAHLDPLLCFAPEELHSKGDVINPAFGMYADVAGKDRRIKEVHLLFMVFHVSFKDLKLKNTQAL